MDSSTISCRICGASDVHAIQLHLRDHHPGVTLEQYQADYPDAPIYSEAAKARLAAKSAATPAPTAAAPVQPISLHHAALKAVPPAASAHVITKKALHELFELPDTPAVRNGRGQPIGVSTYTASAHTRVYVPEVDKAHVWNPSDLKDELMAIEMGWPLLIYGHKGTGKSTDAEQIAARCTRPLIRVQHTSNTEEAHITGQWVVENGNTVFQLGFLAEAMLNGMIYLADEYDVALPGVCAVYQPVLEGKPLVIKDAPPHLRIIKPAPGFTFVATGNTNGTGDPTGLYPGTTIQNSANYDRFVIKMRKGYMPEKVEVDAIVAQVGIDAREAQKLVKLANEIRKMFDSGKLSDTISTRALINTARVGLMRSDMRLGLKLCYANGLNEVDFQAVDGVAQRIFG